MLFLHVTLRLSDIIFYCPRKVLDAGTLVSRHSVFYTTELTDRQLSLYG